MYRNPTIKTESVIINKSACVPLRFSRFEKRIDKWKRKLEINLR